MRNRKGWNARLILGIVGLILFVGLNLQPDRAARDESTGTEEAAPPISLKEAEKAAEQHLQAAGLADAWELFAYFQSDTALAGYLYSNGLMDTYGEKFGERFPVDVFQVEAIDPAGNRYLVDVHPSSGEVTRFRPSPVTGAVKLDPPPDREQRALQYLQSVGYDPSALRLIHSEPSGGELLFAHEGMEIGEARLMIAIHMDGGNVIGYEPFFSLPQAYLAQEDRQQLTQALAAIITLLLQALLAISAVAFTAAYRRSIDFRRGIVLTGAYLAISLFQNINLYPGYKAVFAGELPAAAAEEIAFNIMFSHVFTFVTGVMMYLSLVSGDAAWKENGRSLWARWREPDYGAHLKEAVKDGYAYGFLLLGAQSVVFWALDRMYGVWATNDPLYSTYNLLVPALFPLLAWAAALSEEAIYRLFAIRMLEKLFRSRITAVILSSIVWASAHLAYPIHPVYTRLIEVTILGLLLGWIFLHHGFIAAVFAHAVVDCVLMGLSLFNLGGLDHVVIGILYMASPAGIAWIIARLHDRFGPKRPRRPQPVSAPDPPAPIPSPPAPPPAH